MRILCPGLFSFLAYLVLTAGCVGGLSGCDGKPADGTMVEGAKPLSDEQKAVHRKFYDRSKKAAKKVRRR